MNFLLNLTVSHSGDEDIFLTKPYRKKLSALGLAMSVSTPPEGIRGEVIVVDSFDNLQKTVKDVSALLILILALNFADLIHEHCTTQATGKVLVFNAPFDDPENAIKYRQRGAIEGAKLNASTVLVRSYATFSLGTPHTGLMFYDLDLTKIPAAEISIEDAELLGRLYNKGKLLEKCNIFWLKMSRLPAKSNVCRFKASRARKHPKQSRREHHHTQLDS